MGGIDTTWTKVIIMFYLYAIILVLIIPLHVLLLINKK